MTNEQHVRRREAGRRPSHQRRDVTINLRAPLLLRDMIDRAAAAIGQNRSEFMLESARRRAEQMLLDQLLFVLDDKQYDDFLAKLDNAPRPNARLRKLLATKAPWER